MQIRATQPADVAILPSVERSAGAAFRQIPELAWIADDDVQSPERHLQLLAGGAAWVAVDDSDTPIGFLNGERLDGALHIWELAVRAEQQGRGIGRALITHAKQWAVAQALTTVTLTTFRALPWNEPFYHSLGFVTLQPHELSEALRLILAHEIDAGLPGERRCAMRCRPV